MQKNPFSLKRLLSFRKFELSFIILAPFTKFFWCLCPDEIPMKSKGRYWVTQSQYMCGNILTWDVRNQQQPYKTLLLTITKQKKTNSWFLITFRNLSGFSSNHPHTLKVMLLFPSKHCKLEKPILWRVEWSQRNKPQTVFISYYRAQHFYVPSSTKRLPATYPWCFLFMFTCYSINTPSNCTLVGGYCQTTALQSLTLYLTCITHGVKNSPLTVLREHVLSSGVHVRFSLCTLPLVFIKL